jgi:NAD(P)-dependent dehydrogenase (short-subunit alcohol dehydrogenase family)
LDVADQRLAGRVALVTGGGDGIGRATALRLAEEGCAVGIATIDNDQAVAAAAECESRGARAAYAVADLGMTADVQRAHAELVKALGPVEILVNNVGVAIEAPFLESTDEEFDRTFAVNFMAAVRLTRLSLPAMLEAGRGSVINVASAQGIFGWSNFAAYSSSKGALTSLARQLANEFSARGVRFNSIVPGSVLTPMNEARIAKDGPALLESSINLHIIPRLQKPSEVASAIAFLASDDASFITGSTMVVDGGVLVKGH